MSNTQRQIVAHDPVSRRLHWANAILALGVVMLAWCLLAAPRHSDARGWLVTLHVSFGLTVLGVIAIWAVRLLRHPSPPLRPPLTAIELWLARATQIGMLLLFAAMAVSGYVSLAAAGKSVSFFWVVAITPLAPLSGRLSQIALAAHLVGEFLIYGLVVLHVAAALMHGFIRRDGILERMLPPRP